MKKNNVFKYIIFCIFISFLILLFTSKSSPLYPLNDWVDANAFFTMGKSMFKGVVPYRDLFEQKGLVLYFIYGIGSLISFKSFIGIFILEVVSFSVFLFFAHKIFNLYLDEKKSIILLPILALLITTSSSFTHGGGCEEFCLPYLTIGLYYFIKYFKESKLKNSEIIVSGIMAGLILMMKYTILGFFIGFGLLIFIDYLRNKKYKELVKFCLLFLLGMCIVIVPSIIYLILNGALKDFIDCYFIINITAYGSAKLNIFVKLYKLVIGFIKTLFNSGIIVFLLILLFPLFTFKIKDSKKLKINLIILFGISVFFIYFGLIFYRYYLGPILIFLIISLISIMLYMEGYIKKIKNKEILKYLYIVIPIVCIIFSYLFSNNKYMIFKSKSELFHFKYSEYMNKYDSPTLLNMGSLDAGLYTVSGIIPNTKFFEVQNISYERFPDNLDDMEYNVKNKRIKFILYYTRKDKSEIESYVYDNYELIFDDKYIFEDLLFNAYLFKLKEL